MSEQQNPDTQAKAAGVSRRSIFHILGSVPALAAVSTGSALAQDHAKMDHGHSVPAKSGPYQRKVFNDQQWRTAGILSDLIIPADEHSGSATQAGVMEFMDDWLDFRNEEDGNKFLEAQILGGLTWLDMESTRLFGKQFADVAVDQQKQILDRIAWPEKAAKEDHIWAQFFSRFRDLTVTGYFSSKLGVQALPYLGNTAVAEWKGCDPKVWAVIEDRIKNGYKGLGGEVKPGLFS